MSADAQTLGREFAELLAAKDFPGLASLLAENVDLRGLTPNRAWQATGREEAVDDVLRQWFEDSDVIEELLAVQTGRFADLDQVTYSFRCHDDEGPFVVEQQAYLEANDGLITWMRVLCSGPRRPE